MKKHYLLLTFIIIVIFIGGFLTGALYTADKSNTDQAKSIKINQAPVSALQPTKKALPKTAKVPTKVLISYVQDFRDPNTLDYEKLTHVIFSFAHPMKEGSFLLNGDTALKNLRIAAVNAKIHHTKIILGVGGWYHILGGDSYPYFKAAISNSTARGNLVNKLVRFVDSENLDGIDIDFEHPRSAEDAQNLTIFLKELSAKLHPEQKELSVAVYSQVNGYTLDSSHAINYDAAMFQYVDHVNIMAYDGQYDGGYHAANLSTYSYAEKSVAYWANYFHSHNLPKEKLNLGVPLYSAPENPKVSQLSYSAIVKNNPANALKDSVSINGNTYYYNGETTIKRKTQLAMENDFGGMMMWEAGNDSQSPQSITGTIHQELANTNKLVKYYAVKQN